MDIKEIAITDESAQKVFKNEHCNISADLAGILARAIIEEYKAELLKEVTSKDVLGEPVAWLCWLDGDTDLLLRDAALVRYEPLAYRNRRPLYTSDQLAAAIVKATKPLEDQLAKAEQRVSEACVALCNQQAERDAEHQKTGNQCDDYISGYGDGSGDCANSIDRGEWRKFVNGE